MENRTTIKKSKIMRNVTASILLVILLAASLTGATYAWFISNASTSENVFIAGTVELSKPDVESSTTTFSDPGSRFAFVPNSWDASVSKVNLVDFEEVARYYTAPRDGVDVRSWRTNRIAMDADGNAWALNTGTDAFRFGPANGLQGQVVRIQGDTEGLASTHEYDINDPDSTPPLDFGDDDAVQVFDVGALDDMPRAIAVDANGYIWVGFYGSGELHKYAYDEVNEELNLVGELFTPEAVTIRYYEMKFAPNGDLFISSRSSTPSVSGNFGIWRFDNNEFFTEQQFNSPYALLVAPDGTVYATSYDKVLRIRDTSGNWTQVTISDAQNLRGMQLDGLGNLWIASTTGPSGGSRVIWYELDTGSSGFVTLLDSNTPVGVGRDAAGLMWAISRTDDKDDGYIEAINPETKTIVNSIEVGPRPYAYGDFAKPGRVCKTVEWEFENEGSKKVYVRVKPSATVNGAPVEIKLCNAYAASWQFKDDWWYYGVNSPTEVFSKPETPHVVKICFEYCFETSDSSNQELDVTLEVEAVQSSNNAFYHEWESQHPW